MATFEISTSTDRLAVEPGSERSVSLTITNSGGGEPEAKIWIECDDDRTASYLRLAGEGDEPVEVLYHRFGSAEALSVRLLVRPPGDARAGDCGVKLVVADNTDLENSRRFSPTIRLELADRLPPPPPPPYRKWLIIAAIVIVAVLGTGGLVYVLSLEKLTVAEGLTVEQAQTAARESGHELHIEYAAPTPGHEGRIQKMISHDEGDGVSTLFFLDDVTVEAGKRRVPSVVGKKWTDALGELEDFKLGEFSANPDSTRPKGEITAIKPRVGTPIGPDEQLEIEVSGRAPSMVDIRRRLQEMATSREAFGQPVSEHMVPLPGKAVQ